MELSKAIYKMKIRGEYNLQNETYKNCRDASIKC